MTKPCQYKLTLLAACGLIATGSANAANPKTIYSFTGGSNGWAPNSLIEANSTFYGTTDFGGTAGFGTVFQVNPKTHAQSVIYSFQGLSGGPDGTNPSTAPISLNSLLYGATSAGGTGSAGTLYQVNPATGAESVLYSFQAGSDGAAPSSLLLYNGIFYGTTSSGGTGCSTNGTGGCGTLFSFDPTSNTETVLYRFTGGTDGFLPRGLVNLGGTLYGVTVFGGGTTCFSGVGCGTLFQFDPTTNAVKTLYAFQGTPTDAYGPSGALVLANGVLYGIAGGGKACFLGTYCGVIYSFNPASSAESVFYTFPGGSNGAAPSSLLSWNGMLYGSTKLGGSTDCNQKQGCGTLFQLNPTTAAETTLYVYKLKKAPKVDSYGPSLAIAGSTLYGFTNGTGYNVSDEFGSIISFVP